MIVTVVFTGVIGLYPNLIPSSIDPSYNLTIFNSSSSQYTLKVMLIVAVIFVPIVIAYQIWANLLFKEAIKKEDLEDKEVETY